MYMHELIPFPLAVGDLGTRLALTIIFFAWFLQYLRMCSIIRDLRYQITILKKCRGKLNCEIYEMLFIKEKKPKLNTLETWL